MIVVVGFHAHLVSSRGLTQFTDSCRFLGKGVRGIGFFSLEASLIYSPCLVASDLAQVSLHLSFSSAVRQNLLYSFSN